MCTHFGQPCRRHASTGVDGFVLPVAAGPGALKEVLPNPDGMPKSRVARRAFLRRLAQLGLTAAVAPMVYHLLNSPLRADSPDLSTKVGSRGPETDLTGQLYFPRLQFQCYDKEPNKHWDIHPIGDQILRKNIKDRTNVNILTDPVVVNLDEPEQLVKYPFVFMTSEGQFTLSAGNSKALREYLLRGGFLYADDCTFNQQMDYFYQSWTKEMKRIFPECTVKAVPSDHPIFTAFYKLNSVPHLQGVKHPAMGLFEAKTERLMSVCTAGDIHCGLVGFGNLDQGECKRALQFGTNVLIHCLTT